VQEQDSKEFMNYVLKLRSVNLMLRVELDVGILSQSIKNLVFRSKDNMMVTKVQIDLELFEVIQRKYSSLKKLERFYQESVMKISN
jgi:hypothetical protein